MSRLACIILSSLLAGCAATLEPPSIGDLHDPHETMNAERLKLMVSARLPREKFDKGAPPVIAPDGSPSIDAAAALTHYRDLVNETADDPAYREALRRLADMELEIAENANDTAANAVSGRDEAQSAIGHYQKYLNHYPDDGNNERVLYQLAKAYDLSGQMADALAVLERLLREYPRGLYTEEALFRSGEMHFSLRETAAAELAFSTLLNNYPDSIFYQRALYMDGWSLYLESRYQESLHRFYSLLERKLGTDQTHITALGENLPGQDRALLEDSLKVICLSLSYLGETVPVDSLIAPIAARPYETLVYRRLGEFYLEKDRYGDAANAFLGLARHDPGHAMAPQFHQYAVAAYRRGGFHDLFLDAKSQFVALYGVDSPYWRAHDARSHDGIRPYLEKDISDLAAHYHALARRGDAAKDFDAAIKWYAEFLKTSPSGPQAAEMNFLLAECLHDAKRSREAIAQYERTAYEYPPHKNGAEAGYAALLSYWQVLPALSEEEKTEWRRTTIASALRFSDHYPKDARVNSVLAKAVEALYVLHDYAAAIVAAQRLLDRPVNKDEDTRANTWALLGHAQFETSDYANAEKAYNTALAQLAATDPRRPGLIENLAASIYKQGEQRRADGDLRSAVASFLRIDQAAPAIWIAAQYDAAAALITLADWPTAASVLEDLRRRQLGDARLQNGVKEKLVFVYMQSGKKYQAAREMEGLASAANDEKRRRDIIWEAAALYQSLDASKDAIRLYTHYVDAFPSAVADTIEARYQLSVLYAQQEYFDKSLYWSQEIIKADQAAGAARTDRTRLLAGEASLRIAQTHLQAYQDARLALPLETSLKTKKILMEKAIASYTQALEYQVADVTTAATFQLGGIYAHFAKAIMSSDRPRGLSNEELEQYAILLEEQAFLFEEQAIKVHEMNLRHISDGIYDAWIKESLRALASLYPIRYAKTELNESYFDDLQ